MRITLLSALVVVIGVGADWGVKAAEQALLIDNGDYQVPAIINLPQGQAAMPAVIMLHGTGSHKNEVGDLYLQLASRLAEQGIASIRIDFAGLGDSTESHLSFTPQNAVRDAKIALAELRSKPSIDPQRVGVIGFSQGGLIAQLLIAEVKDVKSFVAWSSVAADGIGPFADFFERDYLTALKDGFVVVDFEWREPLHYSVNWFNQIKAQEALSQMTKYQGALLAVAGSVDELVAPTSAIDLIDASSAYPSRAVIIKGADHVFNVLDQDREEYIEVLELTVDWFAHTL